MAINRATEYPGRFDNATPQQPEGAFKNRTTEISKDGSYLEKKWLNDWSAFFSSLLDGAGVTSNGVIDSVGASQYFDSMKSIVDGVSVVADDGYQILPSGIIMQWGLVVGVASERDIAFPISFPNKAIHCSFSATAAFAVSSYYSGLTTSTATNFAFANSLTGALISNGGSFFAIGY